MHAVQPSRTSGVFANSQTEHNCGTRFASQTNTQMKSGTRQSRGLNYKGFAKQSQPLAEEPLIIDRLFLNNRPVTDKAAEKSSWLVLGRYRKGAHRVGGTTATNGGRDRVSRFARRTHSVSRRKCRYGCEHLHVMHDSRRGEGDSRCAPGPEIERQAQLLRAGSGARSSSASLAKAIRTALSLGIRRLPRDP